MSTYPIADIRLEVFINDRYYHTLKMRHCTAFILSEEEIAEFVANRLPWIRDNRVTIRPALWPS